jgi:hypothetical protein
MDEQAITHQADGRPTSRLPIRLLTGGAVLFFAAGLLLWFREGDRLFTQGLVAAIVGCF